MLVSKPAGVTSHDVVERVRQHAFARGRKVGHSGTLDPFATGLLIVLVGRATRAQRFFMALPKRYRTRIQLGVRSDSGDLTGALTASGRRTTEEGVRALLPRLTGEISQRVPLLSAVKVEGERLYRKARRGEQVETPVRTVTVTRLALVEFDPEAQVATLEVDCSSGTYVRQLVTDLGELCEAGAHCQTLERLAIGPFTLECADAERVLPLAEALSFLPERRLDDREATRASHGVAVEARGPEPPDLPVRLTAGGELIAVAERRDGLLKPITVLSPAS